MKTLLRIVTAGLLSTLLMAQSWTEDRGEQATADELMALGIDVARTAGPPAAPPIPEGPALDAITETVSSGMRCPVCQSLSVADSPSESARNMKAQIRAMLAAGYEPQQVRDYFVQAYGEFVVLMPKAEGANLLAFILPGVGFLLGLVAVVWTIRRSVVEVEAEADEQPPEPAGELDPYLARVRAELKDG